MKNPVLDPSVLQKNPVSKDDDPKGTEQQPATLPTNESVTPQEIQPKETVNRAEEPAYPHETEERPATLPTDEQITQHFQNTASASVSKGEPLTLENVLQRESVSKPNDGSDTPSSVNRHTQTKNEVDEPDWQRLFMNGLEGKEKVLLAEYTNTLRNYKEAKKRLVELEKKRHLDVSGIEAQLRELKNYNAMKDEEIHSLRQRLNAMQRRLEEFKNAKEKDDLVRNYEPSSPSDDD